MLGRQHFQAQARLVESVLALHQEDRKAMLARGDQKQSSGYAADKTVLLEPYNGPANRSHRETEADVVHETRQGHLGVSDVSPKADQLVLDARAVEVGIERELDVGQVIRRDRLAGDGEHGGVRAEVLREHRGKRGPLGLGLASGPVHEALESGAELLRGESVGAHSVV
jgi:hypothetical protein